MLTPIVDIVNVVTSAEFERELDLEEIIKKVPQTEYDPSQFSGLILRQSYPKSTILIFDTGKMISTGTKSKEQSVKAISHAVARLESKGIDLGETEPKVTVQNMVASVNLRGTIDLAGCAQVLPGCMYEPEHFPAIICRKDSATILVFGSGRLVCTGLKTEEELFSTVGSLHRLLEERMLLSSR